MSLPRYRVHAAVDAVEPEGGVLAPGLFRRLVREFEGDVRVGNQGEGFACRSVVADDGRPRSRVVSWGEVYRFNCPYCGDTRFRGWVSHYYGQPDPIGRMPMRGLVGCFNQDDCFADPDRRAEFALMVGGVIRIACRPASRAPSGRPSGPAELPGVTVPVTEPAARRARDYLRDRGFDADELAAAYGLGYCIDEGADPSCYALNRLVIPIRQDGRLVGWQARKLREAGPSPKYFNSRGFHKDVLYGLDAAREGRLAVLVEGVAGVWSLGPPAMATLGAGLTPGQAARLAPIAARGGLAVVLFDPGAEEKAAKAAEALRAPFSGRVVVARVPEDAGPADCRRWPVPKPDPGELRREVGWTIVGRAIADAGWRPDEFGVPG